MSKLTPRQREITELIAQGKTEREVALSLGISRHTVKAHKRRMFEKTGCVSSLELAVKFVLEIRGL
ncbi:MAG: helix-turn-helix transcriptional regulator [Caldilineaceae bacterium]|nr:helix-turn-helix transcriptional regulator [Caldilineaceae bacterium]